MDDKLNIYLSRFVEWMETQGWSELTIKSYESRVRIFFEYLKAHTSVESLNQIDAKTIYSYQNYLYNASGRGEKKLSLSTQRRRLVVIRTFFRFLVSTDELLVNPASGLKLPKESKHLPRGVISEKRIINLLDQPDVNTSLGLRDRTMMEVMYSTGIRNSELRNLSVYDVELTEQRLVVRHGKGSKDRMVPLGEIACDWLKEYLQTVRPKLIKDPDQELLFLSRTGRQLTKENLVWIIRKYIKRAGFTKDFTPHSFRHTCATHMLKHGADIRYIQQMLGHRSVATTQIYTKVESKDLKQIHRRCHPRERWNE
jgi:integrase/recombinase XerD